ncbi:hypothetical protein [uncultured Maribacter sp.]|uniref:hypothetical protein n=1 Tax=uncultured Maribacter sp. TaxID=431308 RepID=UPI00261AAE89|nr:hypothetical protein [uncultured Maribacter sp.]
MKLKKTLGKINKHIYIGLFVSFVFCVYFFSIYNDYIKFYDDTKIEKESENLSNFIYEYTIQFGQEDLTNLEEVRKMETWLNNTFVLSDEQKNLLSYGYEIKYFEKQNLYLFCLYGGDKKRSESNVTVIDEIKMDGELIVEKPSFIEYCFNFSNYDRILFGYYKKGNCYKRKPSYYFYKNLIAVNATETSLMEGYLKKFEQQLLIKKDTISNNNLLKTIYFKFKNKNIELLCEDDFKNEKLVEVGVKLQKYFNSIDLHDIDYGVFPIYIQEPKVEL